MSRIRYGSGNDGFYGADDVFEPSAKRYRQTNQEQQRYGGYGGGGGNNGYGADNGTEFFRASDIPGWDPVPSMDKFATTTNIINGDDSSRRVMMSGMDAALSNSRDFSGLKTPAIPSTFNTTVFGSMRAMSQVTVGLQVRPLRQSVNGPELNVNFRYGDPVFIWARDEDRALMELSSVHLPRLVTAVNYEQLRAFEASFLRYSYDTPTLVGVRTYRDPGQEQQVHVDAAGNTRDGANLRRPGAFERWQFFGVCIAVDPVKDTFPMITVCTQGPAWMLNVFSNRLRIGTDLFFREVHVAKKTSADPNEQDRNTIKTLLAWPPHPIVVKYQQWATNAALLSQRMLQTRVGNHEIISRQYGPYRVLEPNVLNVQSWDAAGFAANVTVQEDNICVIGRMMDMDPTDGGQPALRGGWQEGTEVYSEAAAGDQLTDTYHGLIRVDLTGRSGLLMHDAIEMFKLLGFQDDPYYVGS